MEGSNARAASLQKVAEQHREKLGEAQARIHDLEARLGLAVAEAEELRESVPEPLPQKEVTRISSSPSDEASGYHLDWEPGQWDSSEAHGRGARPMLRLYGSGPVRPAGTPMSMQDVSPLATALGPLPVAGATYAGSSTTVPQGVADGDAVTGVSPSSASDYYRRALRLIKARKFSRASQMLADFVKRFPNHGYADNALYWRAHLFFLGGAYRHALEAFQSMNRRYTSSDKRADALLGVARCYDRLGDKPQAKLYFQRVQVEFPRSMAARLAAQEDA